MTKPVATFRVYPEKHCTLYVRVRIWATAKGMYDAVHEADHEMGRNFWAVVIGVKSRIFGGRKRPLKRDYTKRIVAEMYFNVEAFGPLVIAHESVHAACRFLARVDPNVPLYPVDPVDDADATLQVDDPEERLAYAIGAIANEIVLRARMAGIATTKVWVPKERKRGGSKGAEGGRRTAGRQTSRAALRSVRR